MTGYRGPAPPEVHVWDAAAGRCDRSDCAEIYARCPARGMSQPYNASGWRLNSAMFASVAPIVPAKKAPPPAPAQRQPPTQAPAPRVEVDALSLSPPVSERARQKRSRRR